MVLPKARRAFAARFKSGRMPAYIALLLAEPMRARMFPTEQNNRRLTGRDLASTGAEFPRVVSSLSISMEVAEKVRFMVKFFFQRRPWPPWPHAFVSGSFWSLRFWIRPINSFSLPSLNRWSSFISQTNCCFNFPRAMFQFALTVRAVINLMWSCLGLVDYCGAHETWMF